MQVNLDPFSGKMFLVPDLGRDQVIQTRDLYKVFLKTQKD